MALMMVFSNKTLEEYKVKAQRLGFEFYQTDNIYQFLEYAKEAHPDFVVMRFYDGFNSDCSFINEVRKALCKEDVCPRIIVHQPTDFSEKNFFENADICGKNLN